VVQGREASAGTRAKKKQSGADATLAATLHFFARPTHIFWLVRLAFFLLGQLDFFCSATLQLFCLATLQLFCSATLNC
jgi:hypothetical protein